MNNKKVFGAVSAAVLSMILSAVLTGCTADDVNNSSSTTAISSSSMNSSAASSQVSLPPLPPELELVYAINVGSTEQATLNDVIYQPDRFYIGGDVYATPDLVSGVVDGKLYQSERYGTSRYEIPVTNGVYVVILHMAELYQTETGLRNFNVVVEGNNDLSSLDLYSLVGHDGAFDWEYEDVVVGDGSISISLEEIIDNPTISGIAIYSNNGGQLVEPSAASALDQLYIDVLCATSADC